MHELLLRRRGFKLVAGVDEVGRGAWAGPIVAAAVILDPKIKLRGVQDSKLLRPAERKALYHHITQNIVCWALGVIDVAEIDKHGIQAANQKAMQLAISRLKIKPDYILSDGNCFKELDTPCKNIIKGDYKVTSIAAASILAKVSRDALMEKLGDEYPMYGFKNHKGYGTEHHHSMLMRYGVSEAHRKSFEPMKYL
jgi:ribonuclease HII